MLKSVSASAAFVCAGQRCSLPVTVPEKIAEAVQAMRGVGWVSAEGA
jgi:uncharacterized protein YyaL (SSP411 family)